ncbi:uncharacterized protein LOC109829402 isoform X2 [Asparagus officinalis]|uniref:uncharacterized protein LOC109829402 isoform X2 n=1 Tax=Asparagus officinalis TaxID=4686 RepID=UPI00098E388E|nr:uncharacterized protein LOC109829402 isoform X2 [Asparagus officinalis]
MLQTNITGVKRKIEKKTFPCVRKYSIWPAVLGIIFTILALVASGVALGGSTRFNSRARSIKNIIVEAANNASSTIYSVTKSVEAMQSDSQVFASLSGSNALNSTLQRLDREAENIQKKAGGATHQLNKGLEIMTVLTIVTVSLNLVALLALLASGPLLRFCRIFHMLIILCWVLTVLFWLYFGLYYFLNKFAGDTCAALDEFQQNPLNSTLSSILPCNDQSSAKTILHGVGAEIHNVIDQVNANISSLQSLSLPGMKYICNPFSGPPDYSYQPENCSSNTIRIGNIPQVLKIYTCSSEACKQGEFISATDYSKAEVYSNSIQNIINAYPNMESLVDCQLVKDAFSKILIKECKPLKKHAHMTCAAFATLSTTMVILLLVWIAEAHRESRYRYFGGSIKPHSTPIEISDVKIMDMDSRSFELREGSF